MDKELSDVGFMAALQQVGVLKAIVLLLIFHWLTAGLC